MVVIPRVSASLGARRCDRATLPQDLPRVGLPQTRDRLDEHRFSGAVVPRQRRHLRGRDHQVHVSERLDRPEGLRQASQLDERCTIGRRTSLRAHRVASYGQVRPFRSCERGGPNVDNSWHVR